MDPPRSPDPGGWWHRAAGAFAAPALAHPRPVLAAALLALLLALVPASRVGFDPSVERWFPAGDETVIRYRELRERFGNDEFLLVVLDPASGDVFHNDVLAGMRDLARDLEADPLVTRVLGLHNVPVLRADGDTIRIGPAAAGLPLDEAGLRRARSDVIADPRVNGFVVHGDGARASLVVELAAATWKERLDLVERLRSRLVEARTPDLAIHLMGDAVLHHDLFGKVRRDLHRVLPVLALVVACVLAASFRSVWGVVLPMGVVLAAVAGARALAGLLGWGDSPLLTLVPVVLVVTGVADAVHLLDRFFALRPGAPGPREAAGEAVRQLFRPCLFTSVTTAAGFLALVSSPLFPLRQLGALAAAGVGIAFLATMAVLPAALAWLDPGGSSGGGVLSRFLSRLPVWIGARPALVLGGAAALTLLGGVGISRLQVESRYLESFHPGDPVRREAEWVETHVGGLASLEASVAVERPGAILDPAVLEAVDGVAAALDATSAVTGTRSVADVLKLLNRTAHGGDAAAERVPEEAALSSQMLLLYEAASGDDLSRFVDLERTEARVWARCRFAPASAVDSAVAAFDRAATRMPPGATAELTGGLLLFRRMSAHILESQVRSFALALVAVSLSLALVLRSWRLGLLSLVPNLWPLALTLGLMGWAGWWLQPATAMVAAIALGIGVDDSVHFLDRYQRARMLGMDRRQAVAAMFERAGRAVTVTSVVLILGFAVALLSALRETALFAALSLVALALAWAGDVLLLPALLLRGERGPARPGATTPAADPAPGGRSRS